MTDSLNRKRQISDSAQPEQEPMFTYEQVKAHIQAAMMSTTPPQRTWVDLTPQDYAEIFRTARSVDYAARLAAAKLKEKNT